MAKGRTRGATPGRSTIYADKAKAKAEKARAEALAKQPKRASAKDDDASPRAALKRAQNLERESYKLASVAIAGGKDADTLIRAHTNAARNVISLKAEVTKLEQDEGKLIPGEWVRELANKHDLVLSQALQGMPKRLAKRISPHDPAFAEQALTEWVQGVMKTMHDTAYGARA